MVCAVSRFAASVAQCFANFSAALADILTESNCALRIAFSVSSAELPLRLASISKTLLAVAVIAKMMSAAMAIFLSVDSFI